MKVQMTVGPADERFACGQEDLHLMKYFWDIQHADRESKKASVCTGDRAT